MKTLFFRWLTLGRIGSIIEMIAIKLNQNLFVKRIILQLNSVSTRSAYVFYFWEKTEYYEKILGI